MASQPSHRLLEKPTIPPRRPENRKQRWGIIAAWLFANFTQLVPLRVGYWLADRAGDVAYWRTREYRVNVIENLRRVYRGQLNDLALRRSARMVFRTSARNFWDLGRAPHLDVTDFDTLTLLPEHGWEVLDQVRDAGKGGVILTAHFGAFDFVGQSLYIRGYHPYTMTKATVGEFVYSAVSWLRLSKGASIEDISPAAIRRMLRVLRRGGFAGLVADRDFTDMGAPVELFGEETTLPTGPIKVARMTGASIIPVFAVRDDVPGRRQQFLFHIGEPFCIEHTSDEGADIDAGMRKMVAVLEHYISMYPEQWVMFQRVWPEPSHQRRRIFRYARQRTGNSAAVVDTSAGLVTSEDMAED